MNGKPEDVARGRGEEGRAYEGLVTGTAEGLAVGGLLDGGADVLYPLVHALIGRSGEFVVVHVA